VVFLKIEGGENEDEIAESRDEQHDASSCTMSLEKEK